MVPFHCDLLMRLLSLYRRCLRQKLSVSDNIVLLFLLWLNLLLSAHIFLLLLHKVPIDILWLTPKSEVIFVTGLVELGRLIVVEAIDFGTW